MCGWYHKFALKDLGPDTEEEEEGEEESKVDQKFSASTNLSFLFISQQCLSLERRMESTKVLVLYIIGQMGFYTWKWLYW